MLTFDVPILTAGISGEAAYFKMKQEQRSAAVSQVGPDVYFVEAGAAFVAWKQKLAFDIPAYGVRLEQFNGLYAALPGQPKQVGMLQLQSIDATKQRATIFSSREKWARRYMSGPASCYCLQCESAGQPVTCEICAGTVECA